MRVIIERGWGGHISHRHTTITHLTATRAVLAGGHDYIERATGIVRPRYLDYTTRARPETT
jgi:hypothetical protein